MSSERILACCVAIHVVALGGCADVRRGEYWHEPAGSSGAAGSDAMDDGDGAAASTSGGAGESDDGGSTGGDSTGGATGLSFAADVEPLLDAGCERCHSSDGQASTTAFLLVGEIETDYETTIEFVNLGDPEASRLLAKGAGKGHTGGVVFDDRSSEYETILQWIEQGAEP